MSSLLPTAHHQSLTLTLPSSPFTTPSTNQSLKFTFPKHPSTAYPDAQVQSLLDSLKSSPSHHTSLNKNAALPSSIPSTHIILTIPPHSTFSTGLHWHETHDEYLLVLQGKISITLGSVTRIASADDGVHEVPRGTIHGFTRADNVSAHMKTNTSVSSPTQSPTQHTDINPSNESWTANDVIILEFTHPSDPLKEILFRNGVSAFLHNNSRLSLSLIARVIVVMGTLDQYPLVVPWSKSLSWCVVHAVFGVAVPVLKVFGVRGWERAWTPEEFWGDAEGT